MSVVFCFNAHQHVDVAQSSCEINKVGGLRLE